MHTVGLLGDYEKGTYTIWTDKGERVVLPRSTSATLAGVRARVKWVAIGKAPLT